MNIEKARFNMIEQQIRPWDVLDLDVLELLVVVKREAFVPLAYRCLLYTSPSPRDQRGSRMPSSA